MGSTGIKEIVTKRGTYIGRVEKETGTCSFLGIPYGTAARWERAADVKTTPEVKINACSYGPSPWQDIVQEDYGIPVEMNEECLNLNLFGRDLEQTGKTVMVWIYGGAQVAGNNIGCKTGSGEALFDGKKIVENNSDILVVVPNYRVGIWGSVNLSTLNGFTERYQFSNNLARLDIVQCLKWIHENIEAFGGDKNKVTLFGQSAGSANISSLLLMPEARGLFKRVICESSFAMDLSLTSYQDSITISDEFFKRLHVKSVEEAERLEAKTLLRVQNEIIKHSMGGTPIFSGVNSKLFSPVIDNAVIPENYWDYFIQTGCCGIDFLGGTNEGEYDQQFERFKEPGKWAEAKQMLLDHCKAKLDPLHGGREDIISLYAENEKMARTDFDAYRDLKNDIYLRMGALSYGMIFAEQGSSSYLYYLALQGTGRGENTRCPHGAEIPILFMKDSAADEECQRQIRNAWYDFARSGNPNGEYNKNFWKQVGNGTLNTMKIGKAFVMTSGVRLRDASLLLPLMKEYQECPAFKKICKRFIKIN